MNGCGKFETTEVLKNRKTLQDTVLNFSNSTVKRNAVTRDTKSRTWYSNSILVAEPSVGRSAIM